MDREASAHRPSTLTQRLPSPTHLLANSKSAGAAPFYDLTNSGKREMTCFQQASSLLSPHGPPSTPGLWGAAWAPRQPAKLESWLRGFSLLSRRLPLTVRLCTVQTLGLSLGLRGLFRLHAVLCRGCGRNSRCSAQDVVGEGLEGVQDLCLALQPKHSWG